MSGPLSRRALVSVKRCCPDSKRALLVACRRIDRKTPGPESHSQPFILSFGRDVLLAKQNPAAQTPLKSLMSYLTRSSRREQTFRSYSIADKVKFHLKMTLKLVAKH